MRRREFIAVVAGTAAAWPSKAFAQQRPGQRRVGILVSGEAGRWQDELAAFRTALERLAWRDGANATIDLRFAGNNQARVSENARSLASQAPDVILAGPSNVVKALQVETQTIPIVFVSVSDPIAQGIVSSLSRPGGNVTGFTTFEFSIMGKWLDILKEMVPGLKRVGLMIATVNAASPLWYRTFDALAPKAGVEPVAFPIRHQGEIAAAIARLVGDPATALIVPGDSMIGHATMRRLVIDTAASLRIPVLYAMSDFVTDGGLVSYSPDRIEPFRLAAGYVDRILRGEKPSDLPVQQPTRFRFGINLKTAKALGLTVPLTLQVAADEVIE